MADTTNPRLREQVRALALRKTGRGDIDWLRFKQLRTRLGITQAEAAGLVGVHRTALTAWERGRKSPTQPHVKVVAAILDEMSRLVEQADS